MVEAHSLPVRELRRLTDESYLVGFGVPPQLREAYGYRPGQHVAIQTRFDGVLERRSYSICLPPHEAWGDDPTVEGLLAIGVKVLAGGRFSGHVRDRLVVGDELTVLTPVGRFTPREPAGEAVHLGGLAAGSGITPLMSIIGDLLHRERAGQMDLVFANRSPDRVMFGDRISAWQSEWPERFRVLHHWSRHPDEASGKPAGRLTPERIAELVRRQSEAGVSEWFLCGPHAMVTTAQRALTELGVSRRMVHTELFRAQET